MEFSWPERGMASPVDFFVSYANADRPWADWIAWQLEADGYQVVMQDWDDHRDRWWAHEMRNLISRGLRVVAVLSSAWHSTSDEDDDEDRWRVFDAEDPSGERGLLLPVRVREADPPEQLRARVYADLVGRDAVGAREALLAAARRVRGKSTDQREFPDFRGRPEVQGIETPRFPGDAQPAGSVLEPLEEPPVTLRAGDMRAIRAYAAQVSASLRRHKFSNSDIRAFEISLFELASNAANYVGSDENIQLKLDGSWKYEVNLKVTDNGEGFNFKKALLRSEDDLSKRGVEHGLIRAYRLGSELAQVSTDPHLMSWTRERTPETLPAVFGGKNVIPFIYRFGYDFIRIWRSIHTFSQFEHYLERSPAFMDLIFDPLQRPARKYVGIEIIGETWSEELWWNNVLDSLLAFAKRNTTFDKQLLLFADTSSSEHHRLRKYCHREGIVMFEDKSKIRNLKEKDVSRIIRKTKKGDAARKAALRTARTAQHEQSSRRKAASVFVSYAHEDRDLRDKLADHLTALRMRGYIELWSDGQIIPGQEWVPEINRRLDQADIILLLVTSGFLGSEFIGRVELVTALERHDRGEAIVIPVILKAVDWQVAGLAKLQGLPTDGKAVSSWSDIDAAYLDVAQGLRRTIDAWRDRGR
jgi:anti-sigma regulatory factor (Ser/Thr protein kinase)